jgi:hypothetical protein
MTYEESAELAAIHSGRQADEVAKQTITEERRTVAIEKACAAICDLCEFIKTHAED